MFLNFNYCTIKIKIIYTIVKIITKILLAEDGHIKLIDFGLAKVQTNKLSSTFAGTPEYLAPEIIK